MLKLKKFIPWIIYAVFILTLWELSARIFYAYETELSFFAPAKDLVYHWYPELRNLENYRAGEVNVLLMGGSVLTDEWGSVPDTLRSKAQDFFGSEIRIVNFAAPALSTLDSLHKYKWIKDRKFDLVVLYHGINEVRANNVPKDLFKEDYSHYSWYSEINFLFRHSLLLKTGFMTPLLFKRLMILLDRHILNRGMQVPTHHPKEEWLIHGSDIKTRKSFEANLHAIASVARDRGERLMLMTFAFQQPEGQENDPDSAFMKSLALWGDKDNVFKGISVHNDIVRRVAGEEAVFFVDQEKLLDKKAYFKDMCHLTEAGSAAFVSNIIRALESGIGEMNSSPSPD